MRYFKKEEISLHNSKNDCWVIIHNKVYDLTEFMKSHSGGFLPLQVAGKDATNIFMSVHPLRAFELLESKNFNDKYFIGYLKDNLKLDIGSDINYLKNKDIKLIKSEVDKYFNKVSKTRFSRNGIYEKMYVYSKLFFFFHCFM